MEDSVFTKIIKGEIPCHKIYEDAETIVFLDIDPYTPGHALVVPKKQIDHLWDVEDSLYQHLMEIAKKVANRQREVLEPKRVGVVVEGFAIPHVHIHVFPMQVGLETTIAAKPATSPTSEELAAMAERLRLPDEP